MGHGKSQAPAQAINSDSDDVAESLSNNEDERIGDASVMLRLSQKDVKVQATRLAELKTQQLAFVTSLLDPPFGIRDVMEMGGELVPWLSFLCFGYVIPG